MVDTVTVMRMMDGDEDEYLCCLPERNTLGFCGKVATITVAQCSILPGLFRIVWQVRRHARTIDASDGVRAGFLIVSITTDVGQTVRQEHHDVRSIVIRFRIFIKQDGFVQSVCVSFRASSRTSNKCSAAGVAAFFIKT